MPIDKTITANLLTETGYTSWFDFVFHITGHTASKGRYTYSYTDRQGDKGEITLEVAKSLLERLALEEARLALRFIPVSSFAAFEKLVQDSQMRRDQERYYIDVIVRNKENQIALKRLQYLIADIEWLVELEKKYEGEFVYMEPVGTAGH
jgi:hypothetical protein